MSQPKQEELRDFAQAACEAARRAGADFADACVEQSHSISVGMEHNALASSEARSLASISVRAFAAGSTGWASASGLGVSRAKAVGRRAAELARAAEPDPDFVDLAAPAAYPVVEGLFDASLAEVRVDEVAGWIMGNVEEARAAASEALVTGTARAEWWDWALVNSLGIAVRQPGTSASVSLHVMLRRGEEVGSYYEWEAARTRSEFAPDGLGRTAAAEALRYLGSRPVSTGTRPVIFGPLAAHRFLLGVCAAMSAEEVQRNRSFLAGKKGTRIASEALTLVDDPLVAGGLSSGPADEDGFPHARVTLVKDGVLQTYLHNHYTARKSGEPNTGHSTRNGIACTNLRPARGTKSAQELIAGVEEGLYVALAQPRPDTASGQLSALVDAGFAIERGRLTHPVSNTMIAGLAPELLLRVAAVSSDYRAEPGRVLPTLLLDGVRVASGVGS